MKIRSSLLENKFINLASDSVDFGINLPHDRQVGSNGSTDVKMDHSKGNML